jgi:hypothetical protein
MIKDEQGIVGIMQWLKVLRLWKGTNLSNTFQKRTIGN